MSDVRPMAAIQPEQSSSEEQWQPNGNHASERKSRFPRACTARARARYTDGVCGDGGGGERRHGGSGASSSSILKSEKKEKLQCSKIITPLVEPPAEAQLPRWSLRSMWELASLLDFLHMFRPLLNISVEFSAEELETALITPNSTLDDIHIPLLKAIPPVTRMALGRATWVTVLCRKLRDWWHWVAEGELPIVASHGVEIETYKILEPTTRVLILKALCDIRVEQEDIRSYIDNSLKHGIQLSAFRRERIGGDSYGISYWYENDPIIGHRLYREIRKIESKKIKGRGMPWIPSISCQWETVATNLDEFQEVSDKLVSSKNRTEASLGKKLKCDILPDVEKIQKRKERTLKKQHRQALLLDSYLTVDGLSSGRSLRDRKPVTYTFDDYDRSINEAIKITKKRQASPEQNIVRKVVHKYDSLINGRSDGSSDIPPHLSYENQSPKLSEFEETDDENISGALDRSNRRRKRPERYSEKDFVEAVSDEAEFDSDDDIVGEAVYDEEYLRSRKQRKVSSSSEGDDEYSWERENVDEDEEEEEAEDSLSLSEDSDVSISFKKFPTRSRRCTKLRSVDEIQTGPRRSKRSSRPRINYRQYELSESDGDSARRNKFDPSDGHSDATNDLEVSSPSHDSNDEEVEETKNPKPIEALVVSGEKEQGQNQLIEKANGNIIERESDVVRQRRFLDLNELAPSTGFDDGISSPIKGEDMNGF